MKNGKKGGRDDWKVRTEMDERKGGKRKEEKGGERTDRKYVYEKEEGG